MRDSEGADSAQAPASSGGGAGVRRTVRGCANQGRGGVGLAAPVAGRRTVTFVCAKAWPRWVDSGIETRGQLSCITAGRVRT